MKIDADGLARLAPGGVHRDVGDRAQPLGQPNGSLHVSSMQAEITETWIGRAQADVRISDKSFERWLLLPLRHRREDSQEKNSGHSQAKLHARSSFCFFDNSANRCEGTRMC